MRIEVEERKANIVTICDICKKTLTDVNRSFHCHEDNRYGLMTGLNLSVRISSNEFARTSKGSGVEGKYLDGHTDLCRKCHKAVIQWYLDHLHHDEL